MDEFMELIIKAAVADAMKKGFNPSMNRQQGDIGAKVDANTIAQKRAKANKIMFDAHIEAGFTAEQAIQIVAAINN